MRREGRELSIGVRANELSGDLKGFQSLRVRFLFFSLIW